MNGSNNVNNNNNNNNMPFGGNDMNGVNNNMTFGGNGMNGVNNNMPFGGNGMNGVNNNQNNGVNNNINNNGMNYNSQMAQNIPMNNMNSDMQNKSDDWRNSDVVIASNGQVKVIDKNPHNNINNNTIVNDNPYSESENSQTNTNPYDVESAEIANIPEKYKPLSPWAYIGYNLLFSLPLVGIIFIIKFALNKENINKRNYARSYVVATAIVLILIVVVSIIITIMWSSMKESMIQKWDPGY